MEHDLLESDLPFVDKRAKGLIQAIEAKPTRPLLERIYRLQAVVPRFEFSKKFLNGKTRHIEKELDQLQVEGEKKAVVNELLSKARELLDQENFLDANRLLNGISRDIQMLAAAPPPQETPVVTPIPTPEPSASSTPEPTPVATVESN